MKHLGDITKIDGHAAPVVDCIIGGSPCQDLSVAGKRAGLAGARSGLFMEQIRIVKQMREEDRRAGKPVYLIRPRFMLWENVPGAFSSNKGEDFRAVLEETIRIAEPDAPDIPLPPGGKWPLADAYIGDGWSVAYRVFDAQFWGTPQRRRRIALVADFAGRAAPEILFERQGLRGDFAESGPAAEGAAAAAGTGVETANNGGTDYLTGWDYQEKRVFTPNGVAPTLSGSDGGGGRTGCGYVFCIQGNTIDRDAKQNGTGVIQDVAYTLDAVDRHAVCSVSLHLTQDPISFIEKTPCLSSGNSKNGQACIGVLCMATGQANAEILTNQSPTLNCNHEQPIILQLYENHAQDSRITGPLDIAPTVAQKFGTGGNNTPLVLAFKAGQGAKAGGLGLQEEVSPTLAAGESGTNRTPVILAVDCRNFTLNPDVNGTLQAKSTGGQSLNLNNVVLTVTEDGKILLDGQPCTVVRMEIRRLTPLECERLQGFPDKWTDIGPWVDSKGKLHKESSDSTRYKALGNSIALPFWKWLLKRVSAQYERDATMASLFDGISGFVCLWTEINGWDSVKWTSEIDDFAKAVCKKHFGDEETGERGDFYEAYYGWRANHDRQQAQENH